jgi:hypothetical protein
VATVWSATTVVSQEVEGRKHLTRAGKIAIALTLIGLATTVTLTALQDYQAKQAALKQATEESRRTNRIILAGQPLASLGLRWAFPADRNLAAFVDSATRTMHEEVRDHAQSGVGASQMHDLAKAAVLHPFLSGLAKGAFAGSHKLVIVLISLDTYHNAVLPFGFIGQRTTWSGSKFEDSRTTPLSGGIDQIENLGASFYGGVFTKRTRDVRRVPTLALDAESRVVLTWELDPVSLRAAVDRQGRPLTANLPERLMMLIVHDVKNLPFAPGTFAISSLFDPWNTASYTLCNTVPMRGVLAAATLTLVPNELTDQASQYKVRTVTGFCPKDREYHEKLAGKFVIVEFERQDGKDDLPTAPQIPIILKNSIP